LSQSGKIQGTTERNKVAGFVKRIMKILTAAVIVPGLAFGIQAPNQRSSGNNVKSVAHNTTDTDANVSIRRSATSVIARTAALNNRQKTVVTARPVVSRATVNVSNRNRNRVVSGSAGVSRSAISKSANSRNVVKKSVVNTEKSGLSRAGKSRATAVFNDITKIGGGYSACRDAFATCMDQFCAQANDTYRRCYCSDKFMSLRDTADSLDKALGMLVDFQNNNLSAVDKTAAEVNAMYSTTAGEMAIKKDTSASQKMLDEIGNILSGKKTKTKSSNLKNSSLGIINYGDLSDLGDVWSSNNTTVFNSRASDSMSGLEGQALYKRAGTQCANVIGTNCSGDSMFNLASSAYAIMVTQDCNALEKSINAKKENVMQTVRQAEQLLREARLEEYRAHNSQDVNECLTRVENAMTNPMACGTRYERCLDYTGLYIDANTGKPISHQLFDLNKISPVLGDIDVIASNPRWDTFLEEKKKFAVTALDTCRSLAAEVWYEFKRSAMIRIAQMQDAKIEEFKDSCVQTIKECYNTSDGTLADMTSGVLEESAYDVSATRAVTVRDMCYQDVMACAAMYGDANGCEYDRTTRKIIPRKDKKCGLSALLSYVDTVDSARVAQGCENALWAKAHEMCDPVSTSSSSSRSAVKARFVYFQIPNYLHSSSSSSSSDKYPAGCKNWQLQKIHDDLTRHADEFCAIDLMKEDTANTNSSETTMKIKIVEEAINSVFERLCMDLGYTSTVCHGYYQPYTPPEQPKETPTKTSEPETPKKEKTVEEKMEEIAIENEYNTDAGVSESGGFGNKQATEYLNDNLTTAERMERLLGHATGDIREQFMNREEDYTRGIDEFRSEALGTELLQDQLTPNVSLTDSIQQTAAQKDLIGTDGFAAGDPIMEKINAGDPIMSAGSTLVSAGDPIMLGTSDYATGAVSSSVVIDGAGTPSGASAVGASVPTNSAIPSGASVPNAALNNGAMGFQSYGY